MIMALRFGYRLSKEGKEPEESLEDDKPRQSGEQVDMVARIVVKSGTKEGGRFTASGKRIWNQFLDTQSLVYNLAILL